MGDEGAGAGEGGEGGFLAGEAGGGITGAAISINCYFGY